MDVFVEAYRGATYTSHGCPWTDTLGFSGAGTAQLNVFTAVLEPSP